MKKILYFFPDNITEQTAGNKARALNLLRYFKEKGFIVDYVSVKDEQAGPDADQKAIAKLKTENLAANVYLLPRKPGKSNPVIYFLRYKLWDLGYYLLNYPLRSSIPTYLTLPLINAFRAILKANTYDYVIISYVHSAGLIADRTLLGNAKTVIDTHDFLTAQFKDKKGFNYDVTFSDEIKRLNLFNEVWAISPEEESIFKNSCSARVRLVPMMMEAPLVTPISFESKKYDLIYVGNDNVHNITSIKWFFEQVYPLLPTGLNICVIGKINNHIPDSYPINRIQFADTLDSIYNKSKVAICPMFGGTGVKVKVVEALAFGLPVVCTNQGTDGLPDKQNNGCLVSDDATKFAENIMALLKDKVLYDEQRKFAKHMFDDNFSKQVVYKILDSAFE